MLRRVPQDLPVFGALAIGLSLAAFGLTAYFVEGAIGRPSSTSSLALIFIPIWAILGALLGFALGLIGRAIWLRVRVPAEPPRRTWWLPVALGGLVAVSTGTGALGVIKAEQEARPRVRTDVGALSREFRADSQTLIRDSIPLLSQDNNTKSIAWGRNTSEVLVDDGSVLIRDTANGKSIEVATGALDYIRRVDAAHLVEKLGGSPMLAVTISGRATGRRAVIVVIDEDYRRLFEEQVIRFWELSQTPIEVRSDQGHEYIVVGPGCDRSLVLKPIGNRI